MLHRNSVLYWIRKAEESLGRPVGENRKTRPGERPDPLRLFPRTACADQKPKLSRHCRQVLASLPGRTLHWCRASTAARSAPAGYGLRDEAGGSGGGEHQAR